MGFPEHYHGLRVQRQVPTVAGESDIPGEWDLSVPSSTTLNLEWPNHTQIFSGPIQQRWKTALKNIHHRFAKLDWMNCMCISSRRAPSGPCDGVSSHRREGSPWRVTAVLRVGYDHGSFDDRDHELPATQEPRKGGILEGGFCKMYASLGCGALSAKCTAGPTILGYFCFLGRNTRLCRNPLC